MKIFYRPYKRLIWDYRNADVRAINSAIESFNSENAFDGKDIQSQVVFFNETLEHFQQLDTKQNKSFHRQ